MSQPLNKLKIKIQTLQDDREGKKIISDEEAKGFKIIETDDMTVGIMESGTVAGQPVLCFVTKSLENNTITIFQMTAQNFVGLVQSYNGAIQYFVDSRAKKN